MDKNKPMGESIYTPTLIQFATTGVEFASLVERGDALRPFVKSSLRLLPLLYSQVLTLPEYLYSPETDYIEEYITEQSYEQVRERIANILGEHDSYLTTASSQMQYSDTPLTSFISEAMADVYQHVGNLLGVLREQNELALPGAVGRCLLYWREHWGLTLCSALSALHAVYISLEEDEEDDTEGDDDSTDWGSDDTLLGDLDA